MTLMVLLCLSITFQVTVQVDTITTVLGNNVELPCILTKHLDEIIQIEWIKRRNGKENKIYTILMDGTTRSEHVNGLKERLKFAGNASQGVGTISLQNAKVTDEAVYTCRFILFKSATVSKELQLQVQVKPNISLSDVAPLAGCAVEVLAVCSAAHAHPTAEITWNVGSLHNISTVNNSSVNSDGTVNVTSYMMGVPSTDINQRIIQCLVNHSSFSSEQSYYSLNYSLNIHYAPQVVKIKRIKSSTDSSVFLCEVHANPKADCTWSRDGHSLPTDGVKVDYDTLSFFWSYPDLNGLYICKAINKYGQATGSLHIHVVNPRHRGVLLALLTFCPMIALVALVFLYFRSGWNLRQIFQKNPTEQKPPQSDEGSPGPSDSLMLQAPPQQSASSEEDEVDLHSAAL